MQGIKFVKPIIFIVLIFITFLPMTSFAEKADKYYAKKMAVVSHYQPLLKQRYGEAPISVGGSNNEMMVISMVRITNDRIQEVLDSGLYNDAKKAKYKQIVFIDINQKQTTVN